MVVLPRAEYNVYHTLDNNAYNCRTDTTTVHLSRCPSRNNTYSYLYILPPPTCVSPLTQFFAFLEDGIVIVEPARIRKRYLYSAHFWRDIISLVPLDVVAVIAGQYYIVPWLRMTKVKPFYVYSKCISKVSCCDNSFPVRSHSCDN